MNRVDHAILSSLLGAFNEQIAENLGRTKSTGYYRVKLSKGGAWLGARVAFEPSHDPETGEILDRSPLWSASVHDELDEEVGPQPTRRCFFVWAHGEPIPETEYAHLVRDVDWFVRRGWIAPREPVDLRKLPPVLPGGVKA